MTGSSSHVSSWIRFERTNSDRGGRARAAPEHDRVRQERSESPATGAVATGTGSLPETLSGIYERYRRHEGRELITLMPRAAFRELYREARRLVQTGDTELASTLEEGGPMELAAQYAERNLPLPPYDLWVEAYLADRTPFLERLGMDSAPSREEPVAVSVRPIGDGWYAALCVNRSSEGWGGSIRFHRAEADRSWSTSGVFRSDDVDEIRKRFRTFDDNTLRAFLRSVLP